jgi:hypothetical protein
MFLPFRFSPHSFDCYIFLIILLIESFFSINFLNILYHFFNWIIFSIASLNILIHFILCQIWFLFSWLIFIFFNPFLLELFFFYFVPQYFIYWDFVDLSGYEFEKLDRFVQIFFSFRSFFTINFFFSIIL